MTQKNLKQLRAYNDPSRFQFWLAGRRGGKTFGLSRKARKLIHMSPNYGEVFYLGPTNQHAMELMWDTAERLFYDAGWSYRAYISKQRFEFTGKRRFFILGAEKIERVRGHKIYHALFDEVAYFKNLIKAWRAVRPALADLRGGATLATTPDGKGTEAHDFWMDIQGNPDWSCHHWASRDNPWLIKDELLDMSRTLDEKAYQEEALALWVAMGFLAYHCFDETIHIKPQPEINHDIPLYLCFDFNVNPTTLLLRQKHGDTLHYKKEYSFKNSSTEQTVEQFCVDFKKYSKSINIRIRGDAAGRARTSATGKSDYYYVEQILNKHGFNYVKEVPSKNPPVVDRVKYLNGWLKPVEGRHKVEFCPSMTDTIRDLSSQGVDGRHPSPKNNLGHKADAVGYDVYYEQRYSQWQGSKTLEL